MIACRLRMIKFVMNDNDCSHLSDEEIQEYEKYTIGNDEVVDDENEQ